MEPRGLISLIFYSLDESEASINKSTKKIKFRYFGAFHVEDLSWISPTGRRLIHDDMRRRGLNLTLGKSTPPQS
jgi:hypothetical protein